MSDQTAGLLVTARGLHHDAERVSDAAHEALRKIQSSSLGFRHKKALELAEELVEVVKLALLDAENHLAQVHQIADPPEEVKDLHPDGRVHQFFKTLAKATDGLG